MATGCIGRDVRTLTARIPDRLQFRIGAGIYDVAVARLAQAALGNTRAVTASAIQHDIRCCIRLQGLHPRDDVTVRDIDRVGQVPAGKFLGGAHVNKQRAALDGLKRRLIGRVTDAAGKQERADENNHQ